MSDYQQKIYQENIQTNKVKVKGLETKRNLLATIRIAVFLITLILVVYWANARETWWLLGSLLVGTVVFIVFLDRFIQVTSKWGYHQSLVKINEEEVLRLNQALKDENRGGAWEIASDHPYVYDLDIFGKRSLFMLLNRCSTLLGQKKLANWLKSKATQSEILERQEAVKELAPLLAWRQDFQAQGMQEKSKEENFNGLLSWLKEFDDEFVGKLMAIGSKVAPLISLVGVVTYIFTDLPLSVLVLSQLANILLIQRTAKKITVAVEKTDDSVKALKTFARLMAEFEGQSFKSKRLQLLQAKLTQNHSGSLAIAQLSKILYHLEMRKNVYFYLLVNVFLLYDLQWMIALEKWKRNYAEYVGDWLEVIAEVEALQSMAGFAFSNDAYVFPLISDREFTIKATQIGHPLIAKESRVCNDYTLQGKGKTAIITGSNMSGKSTFERTLGVNMVLAFAGAPVCAQAFEVSLVDIFTSMRVQDSLEENVSGFYAELRRIQQLLERLKAPGATPVFYLLDEILKGTNSKDRQNGAKALIHQLAKMPAFGLISTHDLELGELADQFPDLVENFSFNSRIEDGKLAFDYTISNGLCHSFSAT
ncbi:MAG: MutS-related protein, partial [Flammeovirgaceae bacterium]